MRISLKKGYMLIMAMYFVIIAALTSIGIYSCAYNISKEIAIDEVNRVQGYYAAMAGLRYASMMLSAGGFIFETPAVHDGSSITLTFAPGASFGDNIGLTCNDRLTVTATEWSTSVDNVANPTWNDGEYKVTATFSY